MGSCGKKCMQASILKGNRYEDIKPKFDASGRKVMVAQPGNKKYKTYEEHPQCLDCLVDEIEKDTQEFIADTLTCLEKSLGIKKQKY